MAKHEQQRKQPAFHEQVFRAKVPVVAMTAAAYSNTKACWRIGKVQISDPYGWHVMDASQVEEMKRKLRDFEGNTWYEIFVRDARSNHQISAADLKCPIARQWMKANMPDQPYLWTLRCSGKARIWGILSEDAYQLLFWDPEHKIWQVAKK